MKSCIILCGGRSRRMGKDKGLMNLDGDPFIIHLLKMVVKITEVAENEITIDANHELADKDLNFEIELVEIV